MGKEEVVSTALSVDSTSEKMKVLMKCYLKKRGEGRVKMRKVLMKCVLKKRGEGRTKKDECAEETLLKKRGGKGGSGIQ